MSETTIASAEEAFDLGKEKMLSGDKSGALPLLEQAIADEGLNIDLYTEAILYRAQCFADAGDLERAEADLSEAEQGSPDEALWHFSRGIVFSKQGKTSEAKKEFALAKRKDSTLNIPK